LKKSALLVGALCLLAFVAAAALVLLQPSGEAVYYEERCLVLDASGGLPIEGAEIKVWSWATSDRKMVKYIYSKTPRLHSFRTDAKGAATTRRKLFTAYDQHMFEASAPGYRKAQKPLNYKQPQGVDQVFFLEKK
jgi:hypothetical protein